MSRIDPADYYNIHIGLSKSDIDRKRQSAAARGVRILVINLAGVTDVDQLCERLESTFDYPHHTVGLDAAIDMISDLEWIPAGERNLFVVESSDAPPEIVAELASIFPNIIDRWRSAGVPTCALIESERDLSLIRDAIDASNRALQEAGAEPWDVGQTGPVNVVSHMS